MKHASAMRGNGWWPTIASRLSSLNTCFPVCLDTSFKVFGVELGPESSARRSSSAGFRSRAPGRASAVVHLHALLAPEQLHPFSAQSLTDLPLVSAHVELALAIHLQHPGASRVLPRRRLRIVALAARPPSDWLTLPSPALRAAAGGCVPSGTRPAIATHSVVAFPAASAPAATRRESAPPCPADAAPGSSANRSLASSTTATTASAPAASAHSTTARHGPSTSPPAPAAAKPAF